MSKHIDKTGVAWIESFEENDPFTGLVTYVRDRSRGTEHIREEGSNEIWKEYVELCLYPTIAQQKFKSKHKKEFLSDFVTPYDEAFAVLTLENNIEEWIFQCLNQGKRGKDLTRYTGIGYKKDGKKKGWSKEGLRRFNTICDKIEDVREKTISKDKEQWIQNVWKEGGGRENEGMPSNRRMQEKEDEDEDEVFVIRNGFRKRGSNGNNGLNGLNGNTTLTSV